MVLKIILYNAHGGNTAMLTYICQCELEMKMTINYTCINLHHLKELNYIRSL